MIHGVRAEVKYILSLKVPHMYIPTYTVLGGSWGLVSGLISRIIRVTIWVIGVIKPLTKSP